jgi:hypothetical protein
MSTPSATSYQIAKVADILRISRPLALRLVRQGDLPSIRTPQGLRVDSQILAQWVDTQIAFCSESAPVLAKDPQNQ